MDGNRFDSFTKAWASGASRRTLLKGVLGVFAGGLVGATAREAAGAFVCRQGGATCLKDAQCCSQACDPATARCACLAGQVPCGPRCCAASQVCQGGQCVTTTTTTTVPPCTPKGGPCAIFNAGACCSLTCKPDCCNGNETGGCNGTGFHCCL